MIFFYDKKTGNITGTIDGRIHPEDQLKMWVGDPAKIHRCIVEWVPDGNEDPDTAEFVPDHEQEELIRLFDRSPIESYKYRIIKNGNQYTFALKK